MLLEQIRLNQIMTTGALDPEGHFGQPPVR